MRIFASLSVAVLALTTFTVSAQTAATPKAPHKVNQKSAAPQVLVAQTRSSLPA